MILALALVSTASAQQVVSKSEVSVAGHIEAVKTLDGTRLYRLTVDLDPRNHPIGTNVEYEIATATGFIAGGGMFTLTPEMLTAEGDALSVLTGFGGLELGPGDQVVIKLVDLDATSSGPSGPKRRVEASGGGIVDTCTTYCDRCAEKAGSLCNLGVTTYSCSCATESRSCNFTCYRGS